MPSRVLEKEDLFFKEFEPKLKFRYKMLISGIPAYIVKSAKRPSIEFNVITIDHINMKRKLLGKGEWKDISLTLYDPINPSGAQAVMNWIRMGYESTTGRAGYADFYKKEITLQMLGPVGDIVEQWTLKGAFVSSGDFGDLDMSSNDGVSEITINVVYDYSILDF